MDDRLILWFSKHCGVLYSMSELDVSSKKHAFSFTVDDLHLNLTSLRSGRVITISHLMYFSM